MVQLVDVFSKLVMSLMAVVIDYCMKLSLDYLPESLYYNVSTSIGAAHATFLLRDQLVLEQGPIHDTLLVGEANPNQQEGLPHC